MVVERPTRLEQSIPTWSIEFYWGEDSEPLTERRVGLGSAFLQAGAGSGKGIRPLVRLRPNSGPSPRFREDIVKLRLFTGPAAATLPSGTGGSHAQTFRLGPSGGADAPARGLRACRRAGQRCPGKGGAGVQASRHRRPRSADEPRLHRSRLADHRVRIRRRRPSLGLAQDRGRRSEDFARLLLRPRGRRLQRPVVSARHGDDGNRRPAHAVASRRRQGTGGAGRPRRRRTLSAATVYTPTGTGATSRAWC